MSSCDSGVSGHRAKERTLLLFFFPGVMILFIFEKNKK